MKKFDCGEPLRLPASIIKCLLMIKFTIILSCFITFQSLAFDGYSQNKVSLNLENATLKRAFRAIEKQTSFRFFYNDEALPMRQDVTLRVSNEPVEAVMRKLLKETPLTFRILNNLVVVSLAETKMEKPAESITGRVTNSSNEPLAGVSVVVKNTTRGTTTDENGRFTIDVNTSDVLVFSYSGYERAEFPVNGRTSLDVQLTSNNNTMNEVVVIGYGTQAARNVTGAVGRIGTKEIKQGAIVSFDQALTGRVPGVLVTENSAEPGGEISVRIRGISSITSGSEPLVVIDGVPTSVSLRAINPSDIESIDVLKDAASAAIYGSRGSAGVILVTTKRGKAGRLTVNFDAYTGWQNVAKTIPLLSGPEFARLANENLVNGGKPANPAWANPGSVLNTDWQAAAFRTAPIQNYNIALSGGSDKVRTMFSVGYTNQSGIIIHSGYERITARINLDYNVSRRLTLGTNISFNNDNFRNVQTQSDFFGVLLNVMRANPTDPIYTDQEGLFGDHLYGFRGWALRGGNYNTDWYSLQQPLFGIQYYGSQNTNTQLLTNAFGELEILEGLKFKSLIGYNISNGFSPSGMPILLPREVDNQARTSIGESWNKGMQWNWVNTLSYARTFGSHNLTLLAGSDALRGEGRYIRGNANNTPENQRSIDASDRQGRDVGGSPFSPFSLFSYFGRLSYSFQDKYLLTATVRRDGSSKFAPGNQFGVFPSVSVGWRISQESFLQNVDWLNELKLRASYGSVGNQNIPDLRFVSTYSNGGGHFGYSLGNPPNLVPGLRPAVLGNPDITWEKNTESNIGLDAVLAKGMFNLTVDVYRKRLTDLLGTVPTPWYSTPFNGSYLANAFSMENRGVELALGFNKTIGAVRLTANGNITTINNKVLSLIPGNASGFLFQSISIIGSAFNDGNAQTRTVVGKPVGQFYGYVFDGIIQNEAELASSGMAAFGAKVGDKRFKDVNGDKVVNSSDKTYLGKGLPGYVYGFSLGAEFKGFDFNALFNGQGDVQIANMTKAILYHMRFHNSTGIVNGHRDLLNSWRGEGTSNTLPRNSYDAPTSNRFFASDFIENGAFLRLRNAQLGYTLPATLSNKAGMSRARIYVSAQNLFTITDYSGYDPEVGSATIGNRAQAAGVDYGRYPMARTFMVGLNISFQ